MKEDKVAKVKSLPKQKIMNPYYSTVKTRKGRESVPFLDLEMGYHEIEFRTQTKWSRCLVYCWLSPFGYAWEIQKIFATGKINELG